MYYVFCRLLYYQQLTLESWLTSLEQMPLNRIQQLPAPGSSKTNWSENGMTGDLTI